jgi:hypothetical protein
LFDVQIENIDIITASMGNALATDGGFCTGSIRVVDHQVCAVIKEKEKKKLKNTIFPIKLTTGCPFSIETSVMIIETHFYLCL